MKDKSKEFITPSKTSPKGSRRGGCLCKDNTYKTKCCGGNDAIGIWGNQFHPEASTN